MKRIIPVISVAAALTVSSGLFFAAPASAACAGATVTAGTTVGASCVASVPGTAQFHLGQHATTAGVHNGFDVYAPLP